MIAIAYLILTLILAGGFIAVARHYEKQNENQNRMQAARDYLARFDAQLTR